MTGCMQLWELISSGTGGKMHEPPLESNKATHGMFPSYYPSPSLVTSKSNTLA